MPRLNRISALLPLLAVWAGVGCAAPDLAPVRLTRVALLGDTMGAGALATWPRVSPRHPAGFWIVVPQPGSVPFQPVAFDDGGNFLGEVSAPDSPTTGFVQPLFARIAADSTIWIFDMARRVLVFDATRKYLRTIQLPITPWDAALLPDGRIAITSSAYASPLPWILLDRDGRDIRRVGSEKGDPGVTSPRQIIAAPDGTIWTTSRTGTLRLEHWDTAGTLLGAFEPTSTWFTGASASDSTPGAGHPEPSLQGGWIADDGRLWLVGKAIDPAWQVNREPEGLTTARQDHAYDTIIEVRDAETGTVVDSARIDASYPFVVEPGVVMRPVVIEGGWFLAELASVRLVKEPSRR